MTFVTIFHMNSSRFPPRHFPQFAVGLKDTRLNCTHQDRIQVFRSNFAVLRL